MHIACLFLVHKNILEICVKCIDCKFIPCYIICTSLNKKGSENMAKDRYQVSVAPELSKKVKELAAKQGRTPSNLIAYMVQYYFENNK